MLNTRILNFIYNIVLYILYYIKTKEYEKFSSVKWFRIAKSWLKNKSKDLIFRMKKKVGGGLDGYIYEVEKKE